MAIIKNEGMKKLKKLNLSQTDAEILNDCDMKMILGGELVYEACEKTATQCNGICGPEVSTSGSFIPRKCEKTTYQSVTHCVCVPK